MTEKNLCHWSAVDLASSIRAREISAVQVMQEHLNRIEELNPLINCLVQMIPASECLKMAESADRAVASGESLGALHGLPTALKDLLDVAGLRTSFGSRAFSDYPPVDEDCFLAKQLRKAGALIIGKTNTPEYGVGALTFNSVFGTTRNPWDLSKHAGGSSSAAAALAAGLLPLADGSDSGGSLRYPSSFCNTVALRPTPGKIPKDSSGNGWSPHSVLGPMARSSSDARLYLDAVSGSEDFDPLSIGPARTRSSGNALDSIQGLKIAWSKDLGGLPISADIENGYSETKDRLVSLGALVEDVALDCAEVDEAWEIIEMFGFFSLGWRGVEAAPDQYRTDFRRNVIQGSGTSAKELSWAREKRTHFYRYIAALMRNYDVIATPATPTSAPSAEVEWVDEIGGHYFDRYFQWQRMSSRVTLSAHPALVTPGGFTPQGLPFGIQLVGKYGEDNELLRVGSVVEEALGFIHKTPSLTA